VRASCWYAGRREEGEGRRKRKRKIKIKENLENEKKWEKNEGMQVSG